MVTFCQIVILIVFICGFFDDLWKILSKVDDTLHKYIYTVILLVFSFLFFLCYLKAGTFSELF